MAMALDFLKNHWISLLSGVVSIVAVCVCLMFISSDSVKTAMNKRVDAAREVSTLKSDPKNEAIINAEKARLKNFQDEYDKAVKLADTFNAREPLLPGVFPKPDTAASFQFAAQYKKAMQDLVAPLRMGMPPTTEEVREVQTEMEEAKRRELEEKAAAGLATTADTDALDGGTPPPGQSTGLGQSRAGGGGRPGGNPAAAANVESKEAELRARVIRANSVRMYGSLDFVRACSFHVSPIVDTEVAPEAHNLFFAQVAYWIQEDIVKTIQEMNDEAAKSISGEASVAQMPIKHLIQIMVAGYVKGDSSGQPFPIIGSGVDSNIFLYRSFTDRKADEFFDVVRLRLKLVMDQRRIMQFLDKLVKRNHYTVISMDLFAASGAELAGFYYGEDPVMRVELMIECYLSRKIFKPMMPEGVLNALGIAKDKEGETKP